MTHCPSCHEGMEFDDEPADGDRFVCPCCAAEFEVHFDCALDEYVTTEIAT